ncbi:hypothetical protein [Sphingomonas astaxanthinifaciens]|uniref:Methyltransferase domain-containing protein n=1 Tax=Sphingomonas astaxanthinifaciens DSM 22298 TaxID=1123267 RepID=A0ABQ5Z632_9SPHN|nr:hypothetical protein [Sphingomonas astaxanthinifaciens]GLR46991.1 hypothetical protein GCM10007925_07020 [Sphingomonas astaxanthinifaciens DSM 22298]
MADLLFDDEARARRRARALARTALPFLAERIVDEWLERLAPVARRFGRALVTGCPPALEARLRGIAGEVRFAPSIDAIAAEAEASLDLLMVMGELDGRDHLPQLLAIARSRLAPGGMMLGVVPGAQTLPALRAALHAVGQESGAFAARTHPRIEPGALATLLGQAGFAEPVVDMDRVRLRYRSLQRLVDDLRDHGATNALLARPRAGLTRAGRGLAERAFAAQGEGGVTEETVELIHFVAWAENAGNSSLTASQAFGR